MLRSAAAILAGFLTTFILAVGSDALLHKIMPGSFGDDGMAHGLALWVALVYTAVFGAAGAYVAARLAPGHPLRHALILGAIALLLSVIATIQLWHTAPAWYHILAVLLVLPSAWCGGMLFERQAGNDGLGVI